MRLMQQLTPPALVSPIGTLPSGAVPVVRLVWRAAGLRQSMESDRIDRRLGGYAIIAAAPDRVGIWQSRPPRRTKIWDLAEWLRTVIADHCGKVTADRANSPHSVPLSAQR